MDVFTPNRCYWGSDFRIGFTWNWIHSQTHTHTHSKHWWKTFVCFIKHLSTLPPGRAECGDVSNKYRHLTCFPWTTELHQAIFSASDTLSGERFKKLTPNQRRLLSIGGKTRVESTSSMIAKVSHGERVSDTATVRRVHPLPSDTLTQCCLMRFWVSLFSPAPCLNLCLSLSFFSLPLLLRSLSPSLHPCS